MRLAAGLLVLTVLGAGPAVVAQQATAPVAEDPDSLYANRDDLTSAARAAELWEAKLVENPRDYDAAWKVSRARYWLGGHATSSEQRAQFEAGIAVARRANAMEPGRPEGHFWMAANMGALAESFGLRAGLRYRGAIKEQLEIVLGIDPAFQQGSADRALGRWYMKVPGLLGGSDEQAVAHLRRALEYNPESTATHFFLAETFVKMDQIEEARTALQRVLDAPVDPVWAPEGREFKQKATALLQQLQ